ncbi:hypothetical protein [Paraburkholderia sp. 35.1]|uniref:hypothetical protein n=1 Tax=Paraburkholderia sp. 35.1 TaxID=2991058 RepID=UPI003D1C9D49
MLVRWELFEVVGPASRCDEWRAVEEIVNGFDHRVDCLFVAVVRAIALVAGKIAGGAALRRSEPKLPVSMARFTVRFTDTVTANRPLRQDD